MSFLEQHAAALLGLALGVAAVCCGGGLTPAEQEAAAQQAMVEEDYQAALEHYQGLLDRPDEKGVSEDMRFHAALDSIKCRAHLGQYDEAVDAFIQLERSFEAEMEKKGGYRHALGLTHVLISKKVSIQTTLRLLDHAGDQWQEKRVRFKQLAEHLKGRCSIYEQPGGSRMIDMYEQPGEPRLIDILDTP